MVVDGVELLRMIRDNEIKDNTIMKNNWSGQYWVYIRDVLYWSDEKGNIKSSGINWYKDKSKTSIVSTYHLVNTNVIEIIEDKEINIQAIENLDYKNKLIDVTDVVDRVNEIIKALKQLDKKIK